MSCLKIWFDILTPKQVMFFGRAVENLRRSGHEVLCTSRHYREAVELARIKKLDLKLVGSHGGADRYGKLRAGANRVYELAGVVNGFEPDIAMTFSSPEGARVAFGLNMRHFAFNDSPHSEAVGRLTIPLASRVFCPWIIPSSAWAKFGVRKGAVTRYRALDPAAWLKHEKKSAADGSQGVLIRLEESKASYVADKKLGSSTFVDHFINECHDSVEISILCRYEDQIEQVEARYGSKVEVFHDVVDGTSLLRSTTIFIGAGGTMTAEAALLGKPTISITPFSYYVEKYLVRVGLVKKASSPKMLVKLAKMMLSNEKYRVTQSKKAQIILNSMEDPTDRMITAVNSVRL
jgi:predicted glycosyltransferase